MNLSGYYSHNLPVDEHLGPATKAHLLQYVSSFAWASKVETNKIICRLTTHTITHHHLDTRERGARERAARVPVLVDQLRYYLIFLSDLLTNLQLGGGQHPAPQGQGSDAGRPVSYFLSLQLFISLEPSSAIPPGPSSIGWWWLRCRWRLFRRGDPDSLASRRTHQWTNPRKMEMESHQTIL